MRISRTRNFRVSLGNFGEKVEVGVSVTFDHYDLGYSDEEWLDYVKENGTAAAADLIVEELENELDKHLVEEVNNAVELRDEDENINSVFSVNYGHTKEPKHGTSRKRKPSSRGR